jgi:hypothetical protein
MPRFGVVRLTALALAACMAVLAAPPALALQESESAEPDFSDLDPEAEAQAPADIPPETAAVLAAMDEVIRALDENAQRSGNNWQFTLEERIILTVTDTNSGRMRVITPIAEVANLPEGALMRLMQANFDTALDARYAVADGLVWGAFIHPLDSLTTRDFASGILQALTLAETFGTTFSSGALNYGGGDSGAIIEDQLKELLEELDKRATT